MAMTGQIPGRAGALVASLGPRAQVHDMYDAEGAAMYHDLSLRDQAEVREVLRLVRSRPGPVLELAAGSGRFTVPLLAAGHDVTALELSSSMLALLTERLSGLPERLRSRCTFVQADMSDFSISRGFGSIVLGTTSISLLDEKGRAGLFRAVVRHLAPGGQFVLTTVDIPGSSAVTDEHYPLHGDSGQAYVMHEHFDPVSAVRSVVIHPALETLADDAPVIFSTSAVHVLDADRVVAEMAQHGLVVQSSLDVRVPGHYRDVLLVVESTGGAS